MPLKYLIVGLLALVCSVAQAAEDFNVWSNQTFASAVTPYTDGVVAVSDPISNNNGLNSIKIVIQYNAGLPITGCDCLITALIEEEISPGVWVPLAAQHEPINTSFNAPTRVLIASPAININPGTDEYINIGDGVRVSHTTAVAPDTFRVKVIVEQFTSSTPLTSLTISASVRKFDS